MKIQKFSYRDSAKGWQLDSVEFGDLNLLVGVSGVGKTKTLRAINSLVDISNGQSANGVEWAITFIDENDRVCNWEGKFENLGLARELSDFFPIDKDDEDASDLPKLLSEVLLVNNEEVIRRTESDIIFRKQPTLKLSPSESVIKLLKEEDDIAPLHRSLNKIIWRREFGRGRVVEFDRFAQKYRSLIQIQNSNLDTLLKLALLSRNEPKIFEEIKNNFISVFPHVEDMKVDVIDQSDLPLKIAQFPFLQIKERHIDRWIYPWELASGMLKSLAVISDLYLLPSQSVILIDEFENSLGVNCIDYVGELLSQKRNLQLIVTSHHPYIINTIDMQYWKILTRRGGVVQAHQASDFKRLSKKSMHDNFTRLLEIDEFIQGIAEG